MDLREIEWGDVDGINLAQDREQWGAQFYNMLEETSLIPNEQPIAVTRTSVMVKMSLTSDRGVVV
jgi:hypothetical protein